MQKPNVEYILTVEDRHAAIDRLAFRQGVDIEPFESLIGDFWPADESADDFLAFTREGRP